MIVTDPCCAQYEDGTPNLTLLMPERLDGLKIGDPIFLPVALANQTESVQFGCALFGYTAPLRFEAIVDGHSVLGGLESGFGGGPARHYEPGTIDSTVLIINLWTPTLTAKLVQTQHCRLKLNFEGIGDRTCQINFDGTSLSDEAMKQIPIAASFLSKENGIVAWVSTANPLGVSLELEHYTTPVSGLAPDFQYINGGHPDSDGMMDSRRKFLRSYCEGYMDYLKLHAKPDSRLIRYGEFAEIKSHLRANPSIKDWNQILSRLRNFFSECDPEEQFFYAVHTFPLAWSDGYPDKKKMALLQNMLPLFASLATTNQGVEFSITSIIPAQREFPKVPGADREDAGKRSGAGLDKE